MPATNTQPLRIGLTSSGSERWTGGLTYQVNLLEALRLGAPEVEVYVAAAPNARPPADHPNCHFIKPLSPAGRAERLIQAASMRLFDHDYLLQRAFSRAAPGGLDAMYPTRLSIGGKTARLFWIPDFQFIHLPQMYAPAAIKTIRRKYLKGAQSAHIVVFSSHNALEDFERFAPQYGHKGRVVSFVAHINPALYDSDPRSVLETYHLPEKFFYLPNQFWAHKNHLVVLEALKLLQERNVRPFIVFSGNPIDSRNPAFFGELLQKFSLMGLRDQAALLGLAPHADVYTLLRQSVAVINPSLFEGWSTTVEEAKSVGKRVVISDIAVHREQNPPGALYFEPHNAADLANKLQTVWEQTPPGPDVAMEAEARRTYPERMRRFAEAFLVAVREAIQLAKG